MSMLGETPCKILLQVLKKLRTSRLRVKYNIILQAHTKHVLNILQDNNIINNKTKQKKQ